MIDRILHMPASSDGNYEIKNNKVSICFPT